MYTPSLAGVDRDEFVRVASAIPERSSIGRRSEQAMSTVATETDCEVAKVPRTCLESMRFSRELSVRVAANTPSTERDAIAISVAAAGGLLWLDSPLCMFSSFFATTTSTLAEDVEAAHWAFDCTFSTI